MEEKNIVYHLLKRWNTFSGYTDDELKCAKIICETDRKLNMLAKRYLKNNSTHTMGTMLEYYFEIAAGITDEDFKQELVRSIEGLPTINT